MEVVRIFDRNEVGYVLVCIPGEFSLVFDGGSFSRKVAADFQGALNLTMLVLIYPWLKLRLLVEPLDRRWLRIGRSY